MKVLKKNYKLILILSFFSTLVLLFQNCGGFGSLDSELPIDQNENLRSVFWESTLGRTYVSVSSDSLLATKDDGAEIATRSIYANFASNQGVWYFEAIVADIISSNRQRVGIASTTDRMPDGTPTAAASYGLDFDGSFSIFENGVYTNMATTAPLRVSDCVGILVNYNQLSVEFYVNGTLVKSQSIQPGHSYSPFFFGSNNSNGSVYANFGKYKFRYLPSVNFERMDNSTPNPISNSYGWDSLASAAQFITISQDLKTITKDDGADLASAAAYVNISKNIGKWYFEAEIIEIISGIRNRIGIAATVGRVPLNGNTASASYGYDFNGSFSKHENGSYFNLPTIGPSLIVGNTVGIAVDHSTGTIYFYVDGVLEHQEIFQTNFSYSPMFMGANNSNATININLGETRFRYNPPAGFQPSVFY